MLPYLERCAASINDQENVETEHIVVDGASTDGTVEWLSRQPHIKSISEKDKGMYDAVNKGLRMANGDILAYLNCDEQYLPGALAVVKNYFESHPSVDILFGDALLIRPDGSLIAYRKGYRPHWFYILASHLYVLSCTMFFRKKIIEDGFFFDTRYRAVGDADFVVRLLRNGYHAKHIKRYFSAFAMTGKNLSNDALGIEEQKQLLRSAPVYLRICKPILNVFRLAGKFFSGAYFQKWPLEYSVYIYDNAMENQQNQRKTFHVSNASFRWHFE